MRPFQSLLALVLAFPGLTRAGEEHPPAAASPWGAEYFPDVTLTTQTGQPVRFFTDLLAGKVVVVNFIYTSCADACPLETARLAEVQDVLGERVGRDIFFYSISIDPERDTVAALASYAERFGAGPGWLFLRGAPADVRLLREKLGVLGADERELKDHSLNLVIGNQATGRWMRRSPFENAWVLADEIGSWLHNWKLPPPTIVEGDGASLGPVSRGEQLFRTRCSACHVIGNGDGLARVGPNLQGVVEWRERAWLERWIAEPDRMLAEGDPLATTLFEAYRRVPMPNMRLNQLEVAAVLDFLQEESRRTLGEPPLAPSEPPACCAKEDVLVLAAQAPDEPGTPRPAGARAVWLSPAPLLGAGLLLALGAMLAALTRLGRARPQP